VSEIRKRLSYPLTFTKGSNLFETNNSEGTIGHYSAIDGSVVNASLISGLNFEPRGIIVNIVQHPPENRMVIRWMLQPSP